MVHKNINFVPGLYKIFDEILVNAADNKVRDPSMDTLRVDIDPVSTGAPRQGRRTALRAAGEALGCPAWRARNGQATRLNFTPLCLTRACCPLSLGVPQLLVAAPGALAGPRAAPCPPPVCFHAGQGLHQGAEQRRRHPGGSPQDRGAAVGLLCPGVSEHPTFLAGRRLAAAAGSAAAM